MEGPVRLSRTGPAVFTVAAAEGGCLTPASPSPGRTAGHVPLRRELTPHVDDPDDGTDTIAWLREQPWCDGITGGYGGSCLGFVQGASASRYLAGIEGDRPDGDHDRLPSDALALRGWRRVVAHHVDLGHNTDSGCSVTTGAERGRLVRPVHRQYHPDVHPDTRRARQRRAREGQRLRSRPPRPPTLTPATRPGRYRA